jgi:opacity protein-like surface antigen
MVKAALKTALLLTVSLASVQAAAQTQAPASNPIKREGQEISAAARGMFEPPQTFFSPQNLTLSAGVGFTNFTQQGTDNLTGAGGGWMLRAIFGADRALAVEGAYVGGAYPVTAFNGDTGTIIQSGLEALARLGFPIRHNLAYVLPYITAGVGVTLFNSTGLNTALTGVQSSDGVFNLPAGFGVAFGIDRLSFDMRFLYRPAFGSTMFENANSGGATGQSTIAVSGILGYRL